jgi:putative DNA primase/helicase
VLKAALIYASWGWHVHPLRPGDKRPLLADWPHRATTDADRIRRWWGRWPAANIGLACGPSGLLAIDLDVKNGVDGLATWEALKAELGFDDAGTPVSNTPSGGRHVLFSVGEEPPGEGFASPRNTAGKLGPGIDTRGQGGYIVLPPSRLAAGAEATWAWRPEAHPRHFRPKPLPRSLWQRLALAGEHARGADLAVAGAGPPAVGASPNARRPDRLAGVTAYAQAALRDEVWRVAAAPQGTRNNTLNAAAFSLGQLVGAGLLERFQVERPLVLAARVAKLGEQEAAATVRSGLDAGQNQPRALPASVRAAQGSRPGGGAQPGAGGPAARTEPNGAGPPSERDGPGARDESWLLSLPADDEGHAQCVARLHGEHFLYCGAYGWMQYVGTHWARDPEGLALRAAIIEVLKARHRLALQAERTPLTQATTRSKHRVHAVMALLAVLLATDVASFDASPDHLNVANGVLDLRTGELLPHEPSQHFTYCLEAAYEPATDYRPWRDWLRRTVAAPVAPVEVGEAADDACPSAPPGEAEESYLQMAVGYSLTGHTSEEVLFYLYGPPRSGKGTFTEALLALLGPEPLAAEVHFGTFVRSRNNDANSADLARLKPCRLLVSSEPNRSDWLNAGELKRLTGGNLVFAAFKFRDHFTYRPTYKIWLAGNHPPQADVEDDALWSRLRVIPFPHSHLGHEDRGLKARMKSPEMQRQILAWAVDGAWAWHQTALHGLPTPPSIEAATRAARHELDYVGQWLAECVEVTGAEEDFVPNAALQASYERWRQEAGAPTCTMTRLTQALKAKGLAAGTVRWHAGRSLRGCRGIQLHHRAPSP